MEERRRRPTAEHYSLWTSIAYLTAQFLQFPVTVFTLAYGFLVPEISDWITTMGLSKKFEPEKDIGSLEGKVILVTGGNAGLGKQTIAYLAGHSPQRIYLAARTASKAEDAIKDIKTAVSNSCEIIHLPLDLSSFSSIASAAKTFQSQESRLDLLINNAGVMACPYTLTKESYEVQFGTNHMGHALLTKLLLPTLQQTAKQPNADVRIINVTSMAHFITVPKGLTFDQQALENENTWKRYGQSKLANILFSRELATRYPEITTVSVHPGVIITDLYQSVTTNFFLRIGVWVYSCLTPILPGHFKDTKGGALNQTWTATTAKENLVNGGLYRPVGIKAAGSGFARDDGLAKKLWDWTEGELQRFGY